MSDFDYYELLILIAKNTKYLSAGNKPFSTIHGPIDYINYTIGKSMYDPDALRGYYSNKLFDSQNEEEKPYVDALNNKFRNIISKYYPWDLSTNLYIKLDQKQSRERIPS